MKRVMILGALLIMAGCVPPPPPAPPPAPPVAAPAPVMFTVYFAWNRAWIGPEGWAILQQAADVYKSGGHATVQITGYTDTTGEAGYNQRLSERRAAHVAWALAHLGVPQTAMTVIGRGESDLAVPTPQGVPDARNRRVTIVE